MPKEHVGRSLLQTVDIKPPIMFNVSGAPCIMLWAEKLNVALSESGQWIDLATETPTMAGSMCNTTNSEWDYLQLFLMVSDDEKRFWKCHICPILGLSSRIQHQALYSGKTLLLWNVLIKSLRCSVTFLFPPVLSWVSGFILCLDGTGSSWSRCSFSLTAWRLLSLAAAASTPLQNIHITASLWAAYKMMLCSCSAPPTKVLPPGGLTLKTSRYNYSAALNYYYYY